MQTYPKYKTTGCASRIGYYDSTQIKTTHEFVCVETYESCILHITPVGLFKVPYLVKDLGTWIDSTLNFSSLCTKLKYGSPSYRKDCQLLETDYYCGTRQVLSIREVSYMLEALTPPSLYYYY